MYKNYNKTSVIIPALAAAAGVLLAWLPVTSYATSAWVATTWGGATSPTFGISSRAKPALADINNDNLLDLAVGDSSGIVHFYLNQGSLSAPSWSAEQLSFRVSTGGTYAAPALADLDGDGDVDMLVGGQNTLRAYRNDCTAPCSSGPVWVRNTAWEITGLTSNRFYVPALADLDGDGTRDMMLGSVLGSVLGYKNTIATTPGTPWTAMPEWNTFNIVSYTAPALAKMNAYIGDQRRDLFVGGLYGTVYAFQNTGTTSAPIWTSIGDWFVADPDPNTLNQAMPALGDLDGDGDLDMIVGDQNGALFGYINTGLPTEPTTGTGPPVPPATTTSTDNFSNFSCTGAWKAAAGPNQSYLRTCSDGWFAYAQDVDNSSLSSPNPGPIGNANVVTNDNTVNGPNTDTGTLGVGEIYTAPNDAVRGVLWLMKTFPVIPGQPISTIKADFRNKTSAGTSQYVGMVVFDGTVTNPSGQTASGVPLRSDVLAADVRFQNCGANNWCSWATTSLGSGFITPTTSTITVGFRLGDTSLTQTSFGELDNVKISGISTVAQSPVPVGDIAQLWQQPYTASGFNNMAEGVDVAVDAAGNVYMTGRSYETGNNYDIITIKYNATGAIQWAKVFNDGDDDVPVKVAVDGSGNVYVAGYSYEAHLPSGPANFDFVVIKYDNGGTLQWSQTYDNTTSGYDDQAADMALDGSGNAYVTGSSCANQSCTFETIKVTSAGSVAWHQNYGGSGYNNAVGIALDGSGNVYITGQTTGTSDDVTTVKYSNGGAQQWATTFAGRTNDHPIDILTDSAGDSYVTGWNFDSSTPDIFLLKYNSGGVQQWYKSYDSSGEDIPVAMAMDATSGNVIITGISGRVTDHNIVTLDYNPDGTVAWVRSFGNSGSDDLAADVAVDGNGDIYVLGSLGVSPGNTDFVTVKYSPTGIATSAITYDKFGIQDTPTAIALGVDTGGDTVPVVVGYSKDNTTLLDQVTTVVYEKAQPDLTITNFSGPSSGISGSPIILPNTVLNIDDLAAKKHAESGAFTVGFYLAPDVGGVADLDTKIQIGSRNISNLSPGDSSPDNTSITIPTSVLEGNYFLVAIADPAGAVAETDESNNSSVLVSPIAITGIYPDLVVTGFSGPTSAARGDTVPVSVTITNTVSIAAGSFRVGIYLSSDQTITTTGDTLIGSYTVGGLAGFASDSHNNFNVTIPLALDPGSYYLGVYADDQLAVQEANDDNNTEILRTGTSSSTRLVSDTDFNPGLPGTNVNVVGTGDAARVVLSRSTGWGAPPQSWDTASIGANTRPKPALADLDGDGDLDMMVGSSSGVSFGYRNDGTIQIPSWTPVSGWNGPADGTYSSPALADLDGDGDFDMIVAGRNAVRGYRNDCVAPCSNGPVWVRNTAWDLTGLTSNRFYSASLKDLDGDNKPDMMLGSTVGTVLGYKNTIGTATPWTAMGSWTSADVGANSDPALGDLDGDGLVDLLIGNSTGTVTGYRNNGDPNNPSWTPNTAWDLPDPNASGNYASPALGDLNNDGALDMMYGDAPTGTVIGYMNAGFYMTPGTYTSPVKDAGTHGGFTVLHYIATIPAGTTLTVDIRAGNTPTPDGTWTPFIQDIQDEGDISSLNTTPQGILRYVQYQIHLSTTVATQTPALYSIEALKNAAPPQPTVLSVVTGAGAGSGSGGGELGVVELMMLGLAGVMVRVIRRGRYGRRH